MEHHFKIAISKNYQKLNVDLPKVSFNTAIKTLKGIEIMHMIKKGQVDTLNRCVLAEVNFINKLFGIAA